VSDRIAFCDVETTGLDPARHVLWEWAVIVDGDEHHGQVRLTYPQRAAAVPVALEVGRFHDRYDAGTAGDPAEVAGVLAGLLDGVTLCGAQVHFDAAFLAWLLRRCGLEPSWHHRLLDVESMAAGACGWAAPRSLSDTAAALGVAVDESMRHTALGDARTARAVHAHLLAVAEGVTA
jgi:hypothetical protein